MSCQWSWLLQLQWLPATQKCDPLSSADAPVELKTGKMQLLFPMLLPYMCQKKYVPQFLHMQTTFMCRYEVSMSIYMPHMNSMESTMQPRVLVYIHFTLLAYAPEQIYLLLWTLIIPLNCYCSLHRDSTLEHLPVNFFFYIPLPYMYHLQIFP